METVTVSPKFQVVIPQRIRTSLDIKVGQKMIVLAYDNRIVLLPQRPMKEARGLFKNIGQAGLREEAEE